MVGEPTVLKGAQSPQTQQQNQAGQLTQATQSPVETNTDNSCQIIDDLLVMKPDFDGELQKIFPLLSHN